MSTEKEANILRFIVAIIVGVILAAITIFGLVHSTTAHGAAIQSDKSMSQIRV